MARDIKSRVNSLARQLEDEIRNLEYDLAEKKEVLSALKKMKGTGPAKRLGRPINGRKRAGRKAAGRPGPKPGLKARLKARRSIPVRRQSKNRDAILNTAKRMKGTFSLGELLKKVTAKNPDFGGKHPASTTLAVLKTTPEIMKIKRGLYRYEG